MYNLKRFVFFVSSNLLRFLVYAAGTAVVTLMVFGQPSHLKLAIKNSGAYQKFVPSVIESNRESGSSIPLDDPGVMRVVNQAFPPADLEAKTEAIIDGVYAWLDGSEAKARFTVDFTANKNQLGSELSSYAFTRVAFLDMCVEQPTEFDPFTTLCRPPNYDIFAGQKEFSEQISSAKGFLGTPLLTENNLPKNKAGQTIFEQYYFAPKLYKWLRYAPWLLAGLTVAMAASFIWSSPSRRRGLNRLGRGVMGNSLTLIVTPFIFGYALPWIMRNYTTDLGGSSSEVLLNDIVNTLARDFDKLMIWFGSVLLLVGLLIYLAERMTRTERSKYGNVRRKSGLETSYEDRTEVGSPRGKLSTGLVPLQSSEVSSTKKPKNQKRNSKYRKVPL